MREISTLPPKPRAEGSNPSAPAIVKGACKRLKFGVYGLFSCQNRPIGHALIREYSNCCRLVHHQKSISQFREKDGSVPCAEDGNWRGK